ncbi:MAG: DUF3667 domain-containing protein [Ferruginibacter sp.]
MSEIVCKNCGNNFTGKFCNICGEKVYTEKDKSVKHILGEGFHFLTHFEGTFFKTLKTIFTRPGQLSLDYCNGIRKRYFKPLSFFLLLVILYLLFPVFEGLNMNLYAHAQHKLYGKFATAEITSLLKEKNITEVMLVDSFHHAGEKTSKFLLFIIIPALAFFSMLIVRSKKRAYYDHFVFTIESFSFFILWGFIIMPVLLMFTYKVFGFHFTSENQTGLAVMSLFLVYVTLASKRFFNFKWWFSILYAILFSVFLVGFIEYIYKFILFFIAIKLS